MFHSRLAYLLKKIKLFFNNIYRLISSLIGYNHLDLKFMKFQPIYYLFFKLLAAGQ